MKIFSFPCFWTWLFQDLETYLFQASKQIFCLFTIAKDWVINVFILSIDLNALIGPTLLLILVACFLSFLMPRPPKEISHNSRTALQALQAVLVPTCSLWPARYIHLVKRASTNSDHGSRIVVPLSMLLQDVCNGVTELRDPISDLEDLMDGGISAYGCCVCLRIDWKWWVESLGSAVRLYDPGPP